LAQCLGAVVAAIFLKLIFRASVEAMKTNWGLPMFDPSVAPYIGFRRAFIVEMILTFFLVTAVFATAVDERGAFKMFAGLGIGLTLTMCILMGGPLSGASLNPARSFGPALISWDFSFHWLYWFAPLLGGGFAASMYDVLYLRPQKHS
jgi:glycerol uptake facilitator-like aquaporin